MNVITVMDKGVYPQMPFIDGLRRPVGWAVYRYEVGVNTYASVKSYIHICKIS